MINVVGSESVISHIKDLVLLGIFKISLFELLLKIKTTLNGLLHFDCFQGDCID